ncbi:MAG: hypothetical protein IJI04_03600 [Lachnospiraceae bacterium]|nr:hypothetical protein [Lachnospiraceae bacterium]
MKDSLEKKLQVYAESDAYSFHMPGHKRVMDPLGGQVMKLDITEIDGFDNLHDAEGVLRDEMEAAAEMYGAQETLFSVNGSTCALLAAISAAVPRGGTILIERACHMAVYHAAYLRELRVLYVEDVCSGEAEEGRFEGKNKNLATGVAVDGESGGKNMREDTEDSEKVVSSSECDAESLLEVAGEARDSNIRCDAIVITSPTYEGVVKDVRAWAAFAHAHNASLIVDEAHGAHLGFHPYFPESAVRCGADVVVQSTHKTLPAMTQTALLHNVSGRVSSRRLQFFMDIYETSSPSYVLMASITSALRMVREQGAELFEAYARRLQRVRRELCDLRHFRLAGGENAVVGPEDGMLPYPVGTRMDPGKLVLVQVRQSDVSKREVEDSQIDLEKYSSRDDADELFGRAAECAEDIYGAEWLYGVLRDEYHLQMEMRTGEYCLAMTSFADTDEGFGRLITAMREIDERVEREKSEARAQAERPGLSGTRSEETDDARADFGVDGEIQEGMLGRKEDSGRVPVVLSEVAQVMKISDALDAECETVALERAVGRVCADFVILYPPDVPLIVPGEIYTEEKVSEIREWMERGFSVMGVDV